MHQHTFQWNGDHATLRQNILKLLEQYSVFCLLDSNDFYQDKHIDTAPDFHTYDLLVGAGVKDHIFAGTNEDSFDKLENWAVNHDQWLFGHLGYDLKNDLENLSSTNEDNHEFDDLHFFVPELVISVKGNELTIYTSEPSVIDATYKELTTTFDGQLNKRPSLPTVNFQNKFNKSDYIARANALIQHIIEGNIYEVNFCQEFFAEDISINPTRLFSALMETSPTPFACFYRYDEHVVISASMERFLKKSGNQLISQPIKGTIQRGKTPKDDNQLKVQLKEDSKERAENVMIVDLVRNDLSKTAETGSVSVDELFGIYPFPTVHQMISTVSAELSPQIHGVQALKEAFPMGSMTGAPKISAMQLIEEHENFKRGVFSGAVGYITPEGNFDFNVIIRSFIYNERLKYLSLPVGSAITYDSYPEKEFDECMVKIAKLKRALEG